MRPIDADALIDELSLVYDIGEAEDYPYNIGVMAAIAKVKQMPTIDAIPVVRCKDCKWWRKETDHTCRKWGGASPRTANGYCDGGEGTEANFANTADH